MLLHYSYLNWKILHKEGSQTLKSMAISNIPFNMRVMFIILHRLKNKCVIKSGTLLPLDQIFFFPLELGSLHFIFFIFF